LSASAKKSSQLTPASLLIRGNTTIEQATPQAPPPRLNSKSVEKEHILQVLSLCNGKKIEAARMLSINKSTFWRKMKSMGLKMGQMMPAT
jgi:transcriptional regulator of acetoin/glycerol metabolism